MKTSRWQVKAVGVLAIAIASSSLLTPPALAQEANSPNVIQRILDLFRPPRNRNAGAPSGRALGGATRDLCPATEHPLAALVPDTNLGYTLADHPTLWFYVPYTSSQPYEMEFVLIDQAENDVYKQMLPLPETAGVVSVQLPDTVEPLTPGESYRWVLSVLCNPGNRSGDATVNGWIQRIEQTPRLERQLADANTQQDRLAFYAENGLWYDLLTTLAQDYQSNLRSNLQNSEQSSDVSQDWANLLTYLGLEAIAPAPIVPCCTPASPNATRPEA